MKKEISLAILIGLILGLIITFGVYQARKNERQQAVQTTESIAASPSSETVTNGNGKISLFSPEDESVQQEAELSISGTTTANSFVIIFVGDEETITTADQSGNFAIKIDLKEGANIISIHAIDETGETSYLERTVFFSTQKLLDDTKNEDEN